MSRDESVAVVMAAGGHRALPPRGSARIGDAAFRLKGSGALRRTPAGIAPGQRAVFYDGDTVEGGGTIEEGNRREGGCENRPPRGQIS
jgi:hypothetical protein